MFLKILPISFSSYYVLVMISDMPTLNDSQKTWKTISNFIKKYTTYILIYRSIFIHPLIKVDFLLQY